MTRPSPVDLWRQAGGGTPEYSADEYRRLMVEHGLLVPGPAEPLPCGWTPGDKPATEESATTVLRAGTPAVVSIGERVAVVEADGTTCVGIVDSVSADGSFTIVQRPSLPVATAWLNRGTDEPHHARGRERTDEEQAKLAELDANLAGLARRQAQATPPHEGHVHVSFASGGVIADRPLTAAEQADRRRARAEADLAENPPVVESVTERLRRTHAEQQRKRAEGLDAGGDR